MRNLGRLLLLAAALLLAFVIGVLVGRRQSAEPTSQPQAASGVQITTEDAPAAAPAEPLPAPVQTPPAAEVTRPPVDQQVQEDAAAVGMTTRDAPEATQAREGAAAADRPAAPPTDQPPSGQPPSAGQ